MPPSWVWCLICLNFWSRVFHFLCKDDVDRFDPFEEKSFASLIRKVLDVIEILRNNLLLPYWGRCMICLIHWGRFLMCLKYWRRTFYFLTKDDVWYAWSIGEGSWCAWNIEEEPSTSLLRMMFDMLDPLGKVLDVLEPLEMILEVLDPPGKVLDVHEPLGMILDGVIQGRVFYFLCCLLGSLLIILRLIVEVLRCPSFFERKKIFIYFYC